MRVTLLLALLLCSGIASAATPPDGPALYAGHCAACHDHPHDRIPSRYVLKRLLPDTVEAALTSGPMRQQAAGLSPGDINALAIFLTGKQPGAAEPDPAANLCTGPAGPIDLGGS